MSRGACKEVYAVHNKSSGQVQAVSVIDIEDLTRRNMESAVQQELEISILCSSLITLNICPNVIQIYSLFRSQYPAPSKNSLQKNSLWDQKFPAPSVYKPPDSSAIPTSKQITRLLGSYSDFQFIRMEFCTGGDMEELVRNSTGHLVDISIVRVLLFQMFYSMYCVRDQLSLRHYDLKLLNFFCTSGASLLSQLKSDFNVNARRKENICRLRIGFLNNIYELPLRLDAPDVVKLADFGTGVISQRTLGDFVTGQQFTTLENAPPEFLILGSTARQAYSADTFCIGLSFLHLLTGHEPYEELLKDVKCPSHFLSSLARLWASPDGPEQYNIINETINCLDTSDDDPDTGESIQRVFYHTFYRYLVLFGIPDELGTEGDPLTSNHVWRAVADAFGVLVNDERVHTRRASKGAVNSLRQYEQDRAMWSVRSGSDPIMCR